MSHETKLKEQVKELKAKLAESETALGDALADLYDSDAKLLDAMAKLTEYEDTNQLFAKELSKGKNKLSRGLARLGIEMCRIGHKDLYNSMLYPLLDKVDEREKQLENMKSGIIQCLEENRNLADGDVCTLMELKKLVPDWK